MQPHIAGKILRVTWFYGTFTYSVTIWIILWYHVCESINLQTWFLLPIGILTIWCSDTIIINHTYVSYPSNHVVNHDMCYFFGVEFVQLNLHTKLDSSTTLAIAIATPVKPCRMSTLHQSWRALCISDNLLSLAVLDTRYTFIDQCQIAMCKFQS